MMTRRSALSIAVMGSSVYVIGGYDGNNSLSTMERCLHSCSSVHDRVVAYLVHTPYIGMM